MIIPLDLHKWTRSLRAEFNMLLRKDEKWKMILKKTPEINKTTDNNIYLRCTLYNFGV